MSGPDLPAARADRPDTARPATAWPDTAWSGGAGPRPATLAKPVTLHAVTVAARARHLCEQSEALMQRADGLIAASSRRMAASVVSRRS